MILSREPKASARLRLAAKPEVILIPAIVFVTIPLLIILAIFGGLGWYIHHQGYF